MAHKRGQVLTFLVVGSAFTLGCGAQSMNDEALEAVDVSETAEGLTTSTYQAENATVSGAIKTSANSGYSGSGYVDFQHSSGDYIDWTVSIPSTGDYNLIFRYANGGSTNRPLKVTVDGTTVNSSLAFNPTGSWTTWKTTTQKTKLSSGTRHIRITSIGYNGGNIDYLQTSGPLTSTITASQLLSLTSSCSQVSSGKYATDSGGSSTIPVCGLNGAVFWKADMDVDCDGKRTSVCNENTDPWYQNQTSATTSTGDWLDASTLPYVVVPSPSSRWDYRNAGLSLGTVVGVIYNGKLNYGVFGDTGPTGIIGEASYAMAKSLGINPDPETGGVDSGVTYIAFTGSSAIVSPIEDHNKALSVGNSRATYLVTHN